MAVRFCPGDLNTFFNFVLSVMASNPGTVFLRISPFCVLLRITVGGIDIREGRFSLLFGRFVTPAGLAVLLSLTLYGLQPFVTLFGLPKEL